MRHLILATLCVTGLACGERSPSNTPPEASLASISADGLLSHVKTLSSDGFEGRAPGTRGEDSAVAYIEAQFRALGLQPGNPADSSFIQRAGLIGFTSVPSGSFTVKGRRIALKTPDDFVATSRHDRRR